MLCLAPGLLVTLACSLAVWKVAFCGGNLPQLNTPPVVDSKVTRGLRSGLWQGGSPNVGEIARRKMQMPSVNNMKDTYYIIWARSTVVRYWHPINIISGAEAMKNLKGAKENDVAKAVGVDKIADWQIVRSIGMQLYEQKDEVKKNAVKMHPNLKFAKELSFGFKEITNNTKFNDNPGKFMTFRNIQKIPPEKELRNLLDDAGDAAKDVGGNIAKVGDNIKGFFGTQR